MNPLRRTAKRLWDAKVPRKRIAALCHVSEQTITSWRITDRWAIRTRGSVRSLEDRQRDRTLIRLWAHPTLSTVTITRRLGYGCTSSTRKAAARLGLPPRVDGRTNNATVASLRVRKERTVVKQVDHMLAEEGSDNPIAATWWRCGICDGRSSDPAGHELCRNRLTLNEQREAA